ncbi:MAG TPA: hypothetical protein G4N92_04410 [Anaerolineae bacterium]|nr:hypothetical protein [Anaerolineae bacterium]
MAIFDGKPGVGVMVGVMVSVGMGVSMVVGEGVFALKDSPAKPQPDNNNRGANMATVNLCFLILFLLITILPKCRLIQEKCLEFSIYYISFDKLQENLRHKSFSVARYFNT